MKTKIIVTEIKKSTSRKGDPYLTVKDSEGKKYSCWEQILFDEIRLNEEIDVEIQQRGQYTNIVGAGIMMPEVEHPLQPSTRRDTYLRPPSGIAVAQETKARYIEQAQNKKEDSIKKAGAARDATLIVTTFYPDISKLALDHQKEAEIKKSWDYWFDFFLQK